MKMRVLVVVLLVVHGLLHVMGFLHAWAPATLPQLTGKTLAPLSPAAFRVVGVLWLLVAVTFVCAGVLRAANRDAWWGVAAVAILVSQALIVLQWRDAWAGTAANVLLLVAVLVGAG